MLAPFAHEPDTSALVLRLLASVHRLVLDGAAPALAAAYPTAGGTAPPAAAVAPFLAALDAHADALRVLVARPCQTNEVGRSAALACGFLWLAGRWRLPLRLLEVGSSAGLNLRWDRYRYGRGAAAWGDPASPVQLPHHWVVPPPFAHVEVEVAARRGCDPQPLDPTDPDDRRTLRASLWPDQPDRHARLDGALRIAAEVPAQVDRASVGGWLPRQLADPVPGIGTVVVHSVVWRYVPEADRATAQRALEDAGARATAHAPLAWLHLEPRPPVGYWTGEPYPLTVTTWPGGATRVLATAAAHGQDVRWAGGA